MIDLFLVIHAESVWNELHLRQGHCDCGLSDYGYKSSFLLSSRKDLYGIKSIYSSDLKRAYCTALPLSEKLELPIVTTECLREGNWENVYHDNNYPPLPFAGSFENDQILTKRAISTLTNIARKESRGPILIIVHTGFFRCFLNRLFPYYKNNYNKIRTAVNHFRYSDGEWHLVKLNDCMHLK